jgi:hypothetical protein
MYLLPVFQDSKEGHGDLSKILGQRTYVTRSYEGPTGLTQLSIVEIRRGSDSTTVGGCPRTPTSTTQQLETEVRPPTHPFEPISKLHLRQNPLLHNFTRTVPLLVLPTTAVANYSLGFIVDREKFCIDKYSRLDFFADTKT